MAVDAITVDWLRSAGLVKAATAAAIVDAWGDLAVTSEIISPLALEADAASEADRQISFLGHPLPVEKVSVDGLRVDLVGRPVVGSAAGYAAGQVFFVIGAEEASDVDRTTLTVLRVLA
ncbi:hypothetical protein [Sphingobium aquiterrae]|uniref:hypothetical protein n=1 Tax=Sphingobium aquiterrae TaxID=2038656 RepID=UPI003016F0C0